jgi:hypothetical protein
MAFVVRPLPTIGSLLEQAKVTGEQKIEKQNNGSDH